MKQARKFYPQPERIGDANTNGKQIFERRKPLHLQGTFRVTNVRWGSAKKRLDRSLRLR